MSTTTKHLLSAVATVAFAIAATATTVTNACAQPPSYPTTAKPAPTAGSSSAESSAASSAPSGKTAEPAGKTRAQVQAEYLEARKNGTLIETEADMDVAQTRKHGVK
jgi:hypothetical protein